MSHWRNSTCRYRNDMLFACAIPVSIDVGLDAQKQTTVRVRVTGAAADNLAKLAEALRPLPQTYVVEAGDG